MWTNIRNKKSDTAISTANKKNQVEEIFFLQLVLADICIINVRTWF